MNENLLNFLFFSKIYVDFCFILPWEFSIEVRENMINDMQQN